MAPYPNGFSLGTGYNTLTEAMANAATSCGVNAVMTATTEGESTIDGGPSATIAAVILSYLAVLGDGTNSEEEYIMPFQVPHIF